MKESGEKGHSSHASKKESAVDRALNGSIAILFIIALVLGYAIYVQRRPSEGTPPKPNGPVEQKDASDSGNAASSAQLTDGQKAVLVVPDADTQESDRQAYFQRVDQAAQEATVVEVKDCFAEPLVLKTKKDATITFRNPGTTPIILAFGEKKSITIEAGKTTQLNLDFVETEGIHTYHCGDLPHPAGLLYMTK